MKIPINQCKNVIWLLLEPHKHFVKNVPEEVVDGSRTGTMEAIATISASLRSYLVFDALKNQVVVVFKFRFPKRRKIKFMHKTSHIKRV